MNLEIRILKESFRILILSTIISCFSGIGLELIKGKIFSILPLLILFPVLSGMVSNFGTIFASHYSSLYHEKKLNTKKLINATLKKDFLRIFSISLICAFYTVTLSLIVASIKGFEFTPILFLKLLIISILSTSFLILVVVITTILAGRYFIKKKEDPNNLLIPFVDSLSDLGSMVVFSLLIYLIL